MELDVHQQALQSNQHLLDNQSHVTSTILQATQQQLESAKDIAASTARAAAEGAVMAAMKQQPTVPSYTYDTDFESPTYQPDR